MNENKHTPEPWSAGVIKYKGEWHFTAVPVGNEGKITALCGLAGANGEDESIANARRIVACVNRLAQFTTEQIEDFGYDLFAEDRPRLVEAQNEIHLLKKQRDELLADLAEVKRSAEFNFEQYQDVGRLLHEECEKTEKLLAALERFATWARGQHRAQSKGCHATFDMMMLRDEIDFAEAAIELHGEYARLNPVGVKGEQ